MALIDKESFPFKDSIAVVGACKADMATKGSIHQEAAWPFMDKVGIDIGRTFRYGFSQCNSFVVATFITAIVISINQLGEIVINFFLEFPAFDCCLHHS